MAVQEPDFVALDVERAEIVVVIRTGERPNFPRLTRPARRMPLPRIVLRPRLVPAAGEIEDRRPTGGVRRTRWCDDPMSRGAYVNYRPGQLTRFGSLMTVEEDGAPTCRSRSSASKPR